jgi:uncharacterized repeat protein (TIGR02543 family)
VDDVTAPVADDLSTSHARSSRTTHPVVIVPKGDSAVDSTAPVADGSSIPHARSSRTTHPVVFYPNGGTAVDSQTVATGDTASVPSVPARPGYAFAGWFAEAVGDEEWDFSVPIDEATTLYAHWTADAGGTPDEPGDDAITPDADTDCADYATSADATAAMGPGDPDRLDADSDGTACEGSLPAGDSDDTSDDVGQEGEHGAGAALPNTGNQVPQALVPAAALLLLLGFVLMTWDRRRAEGAPGPA